MEEGTSSREHDLDLHHPRGMLIFTLTFPKEVQDALEQPPTMDVIIVSELIMKINIVRHEITNLMDQLVD